MAFNGKTFESKEITLVTGLFDLKPIAINPTKEALAELTNGTVNLKNEPEYVGTNRDGVPQIEIKIYLKGEIAKTGNLEEGEDPNEVFYTNVRFIIEDSASTSSKGKTQYINNAGESTYEFSDNEDSLPDWFKSKKYRTAHVGEPALYKFLMALSGWNRKDEDLELALDTPIKEIIANDLSELREVVFTLFKNKKVRCMLGVRDGRFQDVFTKEFLSEGQKPRANSRFIKDLQGLRTDKSTGKLVSTGYGYNSDYQNSLEPKRYEPGLGDILMGDNSFKGDPIETEVIVSGDGSPVEDDMLF